MVVNLGHSECRGCAFDRVCVIDRLRCDFHILPGLNWDLDEVGTWVPACPNFTSSSFCAALSQKWPTSVNCYSHFIQIIVPFLANIFNLRLRLFGTKSVRHFSWKWKRLRLRLFWTKFVWHFSQKWKAAVDTIPDKMGSTIRCKMKKSEVYYPKWFTSKC